MGEKIKKVINIIQNFEIIVFKTEKRFLIFKLFCAIIPTIYTTFFFASVLGKVETNAFFHYLNSESGISPFVFAYVSAALAVISNPSAIFKIGYVCGTFVATICWWFPIINVILGIFCGIAICYASLVEFPIVICIVGIITLIVKIRKKG